LLIRTHLRKSRVRESRMLGSVGAKLNGLATRPSPPSPYVEQYAASADGQQFLILKPLDDKVRNSVGVILNWPALMHGAQSR
jgi:hypothetical protein